MTQGILATVLEEWRNENRSRRHQPPTVDDLRALAEPHFTSTEDPLVTALKNAAFWGANLSSVSFAGMDLHGAKFRDCNVSAADFSRANLYGASFHGANARNAQFTGADLTLASFFYSNAACAKFSGADLSSASFAQARLDDAVFHVANLHGTNFSGANLLYASLNSAKMTTDTNFQNAVVGHSAILTVTGMPSGGGVVWRTYEGEWWVVVGCWSGTLSQLRTLIAGDEDWPEATEEEIPARRPLLTAFCDMAEEHIRYWNNHLSY